MNGKQAKRLRKLGRDDKAAKREFQSWSNVQKGKFSEATDAYLAFAKSIDVDVEVHDGSEPTVVASEDAKVAE